MEKFEKHVVNMKEKTFCAFCLSVLSDGNFTVVEETLKGILDILFLTPVKNGESKNRSAMCDDCAIQLFSAFDFKTKCVDTEDCIFPYVNPGKEIDLREVYINERGKENSKDLSEDDKICRLCMQIVTCGFTPLKEVDVDTFRRYIPEINFSSTKEPLICTVCLKLLDTHTSFLKSCLDTKEIIKDIYDDEDTNSVHNINIEDVEMRSEGNNYSETQHNKFDVAQAIVPECSKPKINSKTERCLGSKLCILSEVKCCNTQDEIIDAPKAINSEAPRPIESERETYKCDSCSYETTNKYSLKRHQRRHKNSKTGLYSCPDCNFKTLRKASLKEHQSKPDNKDKYQCDKCDFSSQKYSLYISHKKRHFYSMYVHRCEDCDYTSTKRSNLRAHLKTHRLRTLQVSN